MGKIIGGPFGTMTNKTGNLVMRKVKGQNISTIYVPNPRNPKTPEQIYFRSVMQRLGSELSKGIKNSLLTLYKNKKYIPYPVQHVVSKTALFYNNDTLPAVLFPVITGASINKDLPAGASYDPFFDEFSYPCISPVEISQNKVPLLCLLGFNPHKEEWQNTPEMTLKTDGFTGICHSYAQVSESTISIATFSNWMIAGTAVFFLIDEVEDSLLVQKYNNEINENYLPAGNKLSTDMIGNPVIIVTEENMKELRNYIKGKGFTTQLRKNTTFTPSFLNTLSGKPLNFSLPVNFDVAISNNIPFGSFDDKGHTVNSGTIIPVWNVAAKLDLTNFDKDAVVELVKSSNVMVEFHQLLPTGLNAYQYYLQKFELSDLPDDITAGTLTPNKPISLMVVYENLDTGKKYIDFVKHWFPDEGVNPISYLEYYYSQSPQRYSTPGGNPGIHLTVFNTIETVTDRAANWTVILSNKDNTLEIEGTTDALGNFLYELNSGEMEIVGIGFEKRTITKIKAGYGGTLQEFPVNMLISGNVYTSFKSVTTEISPD